MPGTSSPHSRHDKEAAQYLILCEDLPSNTRPSMFYTQEQIDIGKKRMADIGRKPPAPFTRKKVRATIVTRGLRSDMNPSGHRVLHDLAYLDSRTA